MIKAKASEENPSTPVKADGGPRSVTRLLALFDALSATPAGMTLADIATTLESPKSSLLNLLRPLVAEGFLVHGASTYNLGPSIFRLSASVLAASTTTKVIRPYLHQLVELTGESAMWGELDTKTGEVVFTNVVDSPNPLRLQISTGVRLPLYISPTGWALLAFTDKAWRDDYLAATAMTRKSHKPVSRALIQREMARIRADGVLTAIDLTVAGVGGVIAPVFDAQDRCLGVINIAGPADRFRKNLSSFADTVLRISKKASQALQAEIPTGRSPTGPPTPSPAARNRWSDS